jgi:hypothetical protein
MASYLERHLRGELVEAQRRKQTDDPLRDERGGKRQVVVLGDVGVARHVKPTGDSRDLALLLGGAEVLARDAGEVARSEHPGLAGELGDAAGGGMNYHVSKFG